VSLAPGASVGRYRIVAALGAGGMGDVYRALDTRLKREVALKILPRELVTEPDRKRRFLVEAQSAAALSHARIATVYDADEADGVCYLAMELVAGAPLTERLRSGPMPASEALALAVEVGEGLACAHAKGIVHRDLKPANVMVGVDGHARLIDFGVAKLLEPGSGETTTDLATREGHMVGTPAYMAPEQARGAAVDARADVFSFGLLLYELLSGRRPFDRGSWPDTVAAVLRDPVPPLPAGTSGLGGDACAGLQRVLDQCLAKEMTARPASMAEVLRELEAIRRLAEGGGPTASAVPTEQVSIVVLPFVNLSPDPDNAYFADGLTEEIIADLSQVRALRVISRTSAMRYKGTTKPIPAIAAELKVRHLLEGSVRKAGTNLRITAQLIDAATDAHVWAGKYTGTLDDIFDLQESVSRAIVNALRIQLSPVEMSHLARRDIPDPTVYDDWLRARQLVRTYGVEGLDDAIGRLQAGLRRIGDNPSLMAGLAFVQLSAAMLGGGGEDAIGRAAGWATRALVLDPSLAQANVVLATVEILSGRPGPALKLLKAAHASEPGDWDVHHWLAYLYAGVGRHDQALVHARALVAIDPGEPLSEWWVGWILLYAGRHEEAVAAVRDCANELTNPHRRFLAAWFQAWLGERRLAEEILAPLGPSESFDYLTQLCLLLRDALRGDRAGFQDHLTPPLIQIAHADAWGACTVAECCCILGDIEAALPWLEQAATWGWINYLLYSRTDPFFASLRGDPRFQAFLERVKVQWEQFDA
jgi:serine/threonine protein kinase/tetratricopeptide (TPR) repeat protein